ncbi:MAG: hypothetical protein CMJ64_09320 [Planctomycetaceae bacterium]|nr:hypothetical protein [Planctomycetaceae bacterium]
MKRFTRLGLGFSKKLANLKAACSFFMAYYNFVWRTRRPGNSGRYRLPAAMAAGITNSLWDFERLFDEAMAAQSPKARLATMTLMRRLPLHAASWCGLVTVCLSLILINFVPMYWSGWVG